MESKNWKNYELVVDLVVEIMNIDTLINYIEKSQESQAKMRSKHRFVEAGEPFIIFDIVMKMSDKHKLSSKIVSLNKRIIYIALLVRRLRKALDDAETNPMLEKIQLRYIEIDIESFFHISYSLLNLIARFTPEFFDKPIKGLKSDSFNKQRKWFMNKENRKIDSEYSEYLVNRTGWFEDFRNHRSQLAHHYPLLTYRSVPELELFFDTSERKGVTPNIKIRDFIDKTANGIVDFISFYNNHFGKKA